MFWFEKNARKFHFIFTRWFFFRLKSVKILFIFVVFSLSPSMFSFLFFESKQVNDLFALLKKNINEIRAELNSVPSRVSCCFHNFYIHYVAIRTAPHRTHVRRIEEKKKKQNENKLPLITFPHLEKNMWVNMAHSMDDI